MEKKKEIKCFDYLIITGQILGRSLANPVQFKVTNIHERKLFKSIIELSTLREKTIR